MILHSFISMVGEESICPNSNFHWTNEDSKINAMRTIIVWDKSNRGP